MRLTLQIHVEIGGGTVKVGRTGWMLRRDQEDPKNVVFAEDALGKLVAEMLAWTEPTRPTEELSSMPATNGLQDEGKRAKMPADIVNQCVDQGVRVADAEDWRLKYGDQRIREVLAWLEKKKKEQHINHPGALMRACLERRPANPPGQTSKGT